jgi:hypothetical protein
MAAEVAAPEPDASFLLEMELNTTPEQLREIDDITPRLVALQSSGG